VRNKSDLVLNVVAARLAVKRARALRFSAVDLDTSAARAM